MMDLKFSEAVSNELGNYVYRLIDPRNGETFYVGKGRGNRVFAHVREPESLVDEGRDDLAEWESTEDEVSLKVETIRAIQNQHLQVQYVIHRHQIPEESVFEVEATLIDAFPGLSNKQGGHGSADRGSMHVQEIIDRYDLPQMHADKDDKLILININRLDNRSDKTAMYEQVRMAWRISADRASKADYILAVVRGVVVGAFVAEKWFPVTKENFPSRINSGNEIPKRRGFHGGPAAEAVWDRFVGERGKRIVEPSMKHNQNPIRYWNV